MNTPKPGQPLTVSELCETMIAAKADMLANAEILDAAIKKIMVMQEALIDIAAFDDTGASEYLADTGSYGAFDEPSSVQTARTALKQ